MHLNMNVLPFRIETLFTPLLILLSIGLAPTANAVSEDGPFLTAAECSSCSVMSRTSAFLPETRTELYYGKVCDLEQKTFQCDMYPCCRSIVLLADGTAVDENQAYAMEEATRGSRYGKLSGDLHRQLAAMSPETPVEITVFLQASIPLADKELLINAAAEEQHRQAVADSLSSVMEDIRERVLLFGGEITEGATLVPMVIVRLSAGDVETFAESASVAHLGVDTPTIPESSAWHSSVGGGTAAMLSDGDVPTCVIEPAGMTDGTWLPVGDHLFVLPGNKPHADVVLGLIANTYGPTLTRYAHLFLSTTDRSAFGAYAANGEEWCGIHQARVTNISYSPGFGHPTLFPTANRKQDWYALVPPYPLFVSAAGNGGDDPLDEPYVRNKGYNGLIVGASDDNGTTAVSDDTMAAFSSWKNPGDRELPHLVAPGRNVDSANNFGWSGTSFSAPIVSGTAALMQARDPQLGIWPETSRAILMASATHNVDGAPLYSLNGNYSQADQRDGVGLLNAYVATRLADPVNHVAPGAPPRSEGRFHQTVQFSQFPGQIPLPGKWNLTADRDGRMRVVIAWTNTPVCPKCTVSVPDLDLSVARETVSSAMTIPDLKCHSYSRLGTFEICDFAVQNGDQFVASAAYWSASAVGQSKTYFAIAWHTYTPELEPGYGR